MSYRIKKIGNSQMFLVPHKIGAQLIEKDKLHFTVQRQNDGRYLFSSLEDMNLYGKSTISIKKIGRSYYLRIPSEILYENYSDTQNKYLFVELDTLSNYVYVPIEDKYNSFENAYSIEKGSIVNFQQGDKKFRGVVISGPKYNYLKNKCVICLIQTLELNEEDLLKTNFGMVNPGDLLTVSLNSQLSVVGKLSATEVAVINYRLSEIFNLGR
ncbi:hypothetical protein [Enterococcus phoeniculicola]|uniref:Uncharacterized protein n=1 Tax=Enterococcus phoeniculicola ATCC BAA-412 TaxID=1158610 RepID=R3TND2_9ENTE|nr:hypothetical protein [Enterococcus phoeniculicola]EOL42999.1 hypothetical protein UC3_01976 [Enterococcus phoeniculicola ATCC BAA-412]EOT76643.1 hypothetical protein I589_01600 [Enterococcus phoeniculicola ATCC BAA-412]